MGFVFVKPKPWGSLQRIQSNRLIFDEPTVGLDVYPIPLSCNCGRVIACDEIVNRMSGFQKPNDAIVANG